MPRPLVFLLSLALGAGIAVALVSCGGDDEDGTIPPDNASAMLQDLEDAQAEQDEGDCTGLGDAAGNLISEIDNLPDTVDPEVRTALVEGAQNLQTQAGDESKCEPATGTTGPSGPTEEEPVVPEETSPVPEETTPVPEEEKPAKEPKPKPEPEPEPTPEPQPPGQGGEPPGQGGVPPGQSEGPPESGGVGGDDNGD
jgi:outer membrane biosynthesis protein TonB